MKSLANCGVETRPLWPCVALLLEVFRPNSRPNWLFACVCVFLLSFGAPQRVFAQPTQPNGPITLVSADLQGTAIEDSQLHLDFDEGIPAYNITTNDSTRVEIKILNTSSSVRALSLASALVNSVQVKTWAQDLNVVIETTRPVHVKVASDMRRRLTVLFERVGTSQANNAGEPATPNMLQREIDPPPGQDSFVMVPLKYADVSEVVGLLSEGVTVKSNDSFTPREPGFGSPGMGGNSNANPGQQPSGNDDKPLGQAVDASLAIDRRLNAIWVKGSPQHIARVQAEIAEIDVPVDGVVLETEVLELTETGSRNLGVDFANSSGVLAVATYQAGQYVTSYNSAGNRPLTSTALQAAIYAQVQAGQGKIVSRPRIAAQSGGAARIITGDALPILTAITLSGVNGVSQQVQYVNVGVTLQIAPRVSSDGFVTSHVYCVVSSVTGYSQGYPTISQRNAETAITVKDGESFVIGGLTQDSMLESRSETPGVGRAPLLGRLFQSATRSKAKTELFIAITPHIVKRRPPGRDPEARQP